VLALFHIVTATPIASASLAIQQRRRCRISHRAATALKPSLQTVTRRVTGCITAISNAAAATPP
jgi:hypothetical protein